MRKIRALTLVRAHEAAFERGTEFEVVDAPDPAKRDPAQVGSAVARIWLREKWAEPVEAGKPASKSAK